MAGKDAVLPPKTGQQIENTILRVAVKLTLLFQHKVPSLIRPSGREHPSPRRMLGSTRGPHSLDHQDANIPWLSPPRALASLFQHGSD
eukprot:1893012-Prymnesium_polylepis.1